MKLIRELIDAINNLAAEVCSANARLERVEYRYEEQRGRIEEIARDVAAIRQIEEEVTDGLPKGR